MLARLCLLAALQPALAYWQEECGGDPDEFLLPDNAELDCALRAVGLERATGLLSNRRPGLPPAGPRIHAALNLTACPSVPIPQPSIAPAPSAGDVLAGLGTPTQIFVAPSGSDGQGDGSEARPFLTVGRAQVAARAARAKGSVVVWLRAGVHYQPAGPLTLTTADSGTDTGAPVVYAGYPGENATLSAAAAPLGNLSWSAVSHEDRATLGLSPAGPTVYRAALPPSAPSGIIGLFANGRRLTRARYPNCADITGVECYTLNASGPTSNPNAPTHDLKTDAGAFNLEVKNQHGVDMFADDHDNAPATGPHGASDGTLPPGENLTLTVEHPDYAWRCHEDCGWVAYSKWCAASGTQSPERALTCRCPQARGGLRWKVGLRGRPAAVPDGPDPQRALLGPAGQRRVLLQPHRAGPAMGAGMDGAQLGERQHGDRAHVPQRALGRLAVRAGVTQRHGPLPAVQVHAVRPGREREQAHDRA